MTNGRLSLGAKIRPAQKQIETLKNFYARRLRPEQLEKATHEAATGGRALHDALMDACGWPEIAYDGKLLVSHQDALLMGGKVQAVGGFADHVIFRDPRLCGACAERTCIAMCSGQAITQGEGAVPPSTAKNVFTVARACGTARNRPMGIARISSSAPVRADCTRRKTNEFGSAIKPIGLETYGK